MQERTLEELYKKLKEFDRLMDKEEYLLDEIRDAVEAQDLAFAAQICDFVLNDEFEKFGAFLRTRALMWLTDYIVQNLKENESEYPNFDDFADCLWKFKWIVSGVAQSSMIEKELIDEANETMLFYYERMELSLASYYKASIWAMPERRRPTTSYGKSSPKTTWPTARRARHRVRSRI